MKANELEDRASQVTNTFSEWGLFPTEPSGPTDIERYSSNQEGEKERTTHAEEDKERESERERGQDTDRAKCINTERRTQREE